MVKNVSYKINKKQKYKTNQKIINKKEQKEK